MTYGAALGYQKQFGNLLLGADVGLSFGMADGDSDCTPSTGLDGKTSTGAPIFSGVGIGCASEYAYSAAVRGRIGYAADNWLLYATGGPVFAKIDSSVDYSGTMKIIDVTDPANFTSKGSTIPVPYGSAHSYKTLDLNYFDEKGSSFTDGYTVGIGFQYEMQPGFVLGLSFNHIFLNDVVVDLRRAGGTTNSTRLVKPDPDIIEVGGKIRLP